MLHTVGTSAQKTGKLKKNISKSDANYVQFLLNFKFKDYI